VGGEAGSSVRMTCRKLGEGEAALLRRPETRPQFDALAFETRSLAEMLWLCVVEIHQH
jgi:hypothetical protein